MIVSPQPPYSLLDLACIGVLGFITLFILVGLLALAWGTFTALVQRPTRLYWLGPVGVLAVALRPGHARAILGIMAALVAAVLAVELAIGRRP